MESVVTMRRIIFGVKEVMQLTPVRTSGAPYLADLQQIECQPFRTSETALNVAKRRCVRGAATYGLTLFYFWFAYRLSRFEKCVQATPYFSY